MAPAEVITSATLHSKHPFYSLSLFPSLSAFSFKKSLLYFFFSPMYVWDQHEVVTSTTWYHKGSSRKSCHKSNHKAWRLRDVRLSTRTGPPDSKMRKSGPKRGALTAEETVVCGSTGNSPCSFTTDKTQKLKGHVIVTWFYSENGQQF